MKKKAPQQSKLERIRVAFLHPDLGIGGAERLVVDAALALKSSGYDVDMFTCHHEPDRCFKETADGTINVKVYADWFPRHIFGHLYALCAYIRMILLTIYVVMYHNVYDVLIIDQVSACIPIAKKYSRSKVVFYCHYPDMLLTQRKSFLKKMYRAPLDWLEEKTTAMAHTILVNSKFTARTFAETFTSIRTEPRVLYPSLNFQAFDKKGSCDVNKLVPTAADTVFLSINRYERKKNLMLALEALLLLKSELEGSESGEALLRNLHLVIAGGYDPRLPENVDYHNELAAFAERKGLSDHVTFIRSFSDEEKTALIQRSVCLLYTPSNEHFGITPLEAMYCSRPCIAVSSGGPLETIAADPVSYLADVKDQTGYLCPPEPQAFAQAMKKMMQNKAACEKMGVNGRARVKQMFSFSTFTEELGRIVDEQIS